MDVRAKGEEYETESFGSHGFSQMIKGITKKVHLAKEFQGSEMDENVQVGRVMEPICYHH